jgi:arylsulfatase A-like enzyme
MDLADSTILVVTADHGEEFWEHAELQAGNFYQQRGFAGVRHGNSCFRELIEVPLLMTGPVPPAMSACLVSTVDIVPTIIDLLGVVHNLTLDGRNVFESEAERPLLCEASGHGYEKKALIMGRYKLVCSKDDGVAWLFDLETDPLEQRPIADEAVTTVFVERLHRMLRQHETRRIRSVGEKKSPQSVSGH